MSVIFAYVTTSNPAEAEKIAEIAVRDRLAACANILPGMVSVYHWDKKIEKAQESVLLLKTRESLFPALESLIKAHHSYKNPCIAALPVSLASVAYLDWILAETKP